MKKLLLLSVSLLMALAAFANEPYARDSVIHAEGLSSDQIYESLKKWFITNAKYDSRYIIQHDDAANKHLVGKMNFKFIVNHLTWHAATGVVEVVIDVMARDGRFKIKLSDFQHVSTEPRWGPMWSIGTVTTELPDEWKKGFKYKQHREVYKRVFPRCQEIADLLLHDIAEYAKDFKPIEAEDW